MKIKSLTFGIVFLFLSMNSFSQQKVETVATDGAVPTADRVVPVTTNRTVPADRAVPDRVRTTDEAAGRVAEDGEVYEMRELHLPPAERGGGRPLMEVLNERQSTRRFSPRELDPHILSRLLWAANGVNREVDDEIREARAAGNTTGNPLGGKRTTPSTRDAREIDIYVVTAYGVYLYIPDGHIAKTIKNGDFRREILGNSTFAYQAPIVLVYVASAKRMEKFDPTTKDVYAAIDCGFISQNVYLYCASERLATVILGTFSKEAVIKVLGLKNDKVLFVQPVGHID
jgi:SagB-type dehydrogenase family enzyme